MTGYPRASTSAFPDSAFFRHQSFEATAQAQGVTPAQKAEDYLGGWPEDQLDDGFERALVAWRKVEAGRRHG